MSEQNRLGRILTFYSYKGGTGRTMLLANVAWILASAGKRVLAIDWDFEAPGLHQYFHPFLIDPRLEATDGLIDMLIDYAREAVTLPAGDADEHWLEHATDIKRYIASVNWHFPRSGQLYLLPAGRQYVSYPVRVNTFEWRDFYERLSGAAFLELVKENIRRDYDYILIDSRTGVSDTSGICTVQMPDQLVVCFTASEQNIRGSAAVAASVKAQWMRLDAINGSDADATYGRHPRRILPVFTRIEQSEKDKLDAARTHVRTLFRPILDREPAAEEAYWSRAEVTYWPYYAFEEIPAVFGDMFCTETSLLVACETLTDHLTDGEVKQFTLPTAKERDRVLGAFTCRIDRGAPSADESISEKTKRVEYSFAGSILHLRVFISSPGDVADERALARRLLMDELPYDPFLRAEVTFELVSWDDPVATRPMSANLTPQEAISRGLVKPSECDVIVVVLWSRMGTPLPLEYRKPNGEPYLSGTEWEFEDALNSAREPKPYVLVYRRTETPTIALADPELDEKREQYARVERFFRRFQNPDGSLRGIYHAYRTPSEFAERLRSDLRALLRPRLEALPAPPQPATEASRGAASPWSSAPYPGLRAFATDEAAIFFGREREVDALITRMRDPVQRFLCVVGASGSGKSSLVRAGLLPRLKDNAIPGSKDWCVVEFTPGALGSDPFLALAAPLNDLLPAAARRRQPADLAQELVAAPTLLVDLARQVLAARPGWAKLVLFADQLEELFTLVAEYHRAAFIGLLAQAAADERLRVLSTLRADFFTQATASPTLAALLQGGTFPLAPPGPAALLDMIRRPAERAGLELEDGVADAILADTGPDPGALPLMAFALAELYRRSRPSRRLTRQAYEQMGGLKGAIAARAEEVMGKLPAEAQAMLPRVFQALVHVDAAGTVTRRRADRAELATDEATAQLLDRLTEPEARLLQGGEREGHPTVEVAHEALLEGWPQLRDWLDRHRAELQRVQRLLLSLAAPEREDRVHAARRLAEIGEAAAPAVPALAEALQDADAEVRRNVAVALGKGGGAAAPAVPALAKALLRDADPYVRRSAAEALGQIGPAAAEVVPALRAALQDPSQDVAGAAGEALKRIRSTSPPAPR